MARIDERAYLVSSAVLLGVCAISATSRFYIRVWAQKEFSADDAFLIVAICCLICAVVVMYSVTLDNMYQVQVLSAGLPTALSVGFPIEDMPPDAPFLQPVHDYLKWITVIGPLAWCSVMAVQFSFLFLFRKLIDRIPRLITYWWFVVAFNVVAFGYGFSTDFLICPYYNDRTSLYKCAVPSGVGRLMSHGIARTAVDVIGDLLILYIPVNLIWKIQIRWTQKVPLVLSLCLTGVMILVTITRIAGIRIDGPIDGVWQSYFLIVAAEIGIILASVSTYRALFVSHRRGNITKAKRGTEEHFYSPTGKLMKRVFAPSPWRSKARGQSTPLEDKGNQYSHVDMGEWPGIPRAHLTGVRTFIDGRGNGADSPGIMESRMTQDDDDEWPLLREDRNTVDTRDVERN